MSRERRHPRHIVAGMDIYAKTLFNTEVEILDISTSGASIRGPRRFHMGSEYTFKVRHEGKFISVKGVIVWTTLTGSKRTSEGETMPIYTAGVAFSEGLTDKAEQIKEFITCTIRELRERRLCGVRIRVHAPDTAVLSHLETCVVKDISLGGIRIETSEGPSPKSIFPLELILSEDEVSLHSTGRVAFCTEMPEKTRNRFTVGVEFTDMSDEDVLRLEQFIRTLPGNIPEA